MITILAAFIITTILIIVLWKSGLFSKTFSWEPGKENIPSNIISMIVFLITYVALIYVMWRVLETTIKEIY